MQITINDEIIDYTLESERELGEVVDGISTWLNQAGLTIRSIKRDSSEIELTAKTEWRDESLDDISQLEIEAVTPWELFQEKLATVTEYFNLIETSLDDDTAAAANLLEESPAVAKILSECVHPELGERFGREVDGLSEQSQIEHRKEELRELVKNLRVIAAERLRETVDPRGEFESLLPGISESIDEITEVSVLMQTGKESEAMGYVLRFVEKAEKLMRLIGIIRELKLADPDSITVGEKSISEYHGELNRLLSDLMDAVRSGDSITIGDLLEYEIAPRFEDLLEALESVDIRSRPGMEQ